MLVIENNIVRIIQHCASIFIFALQYGISVTPETVTPCNKLPEYWDKRCFKQTRDSKWKWNTEWFGTDIFYDYTKISIAHAAEGNRNSKTDDMLLRKIVIKPITFWLKDSIRCCAFLMWLPCFFFCFLPNWKRKEV